MTRRQGGERTLVASPVGSVEHTLLDGKGVHAVDLDAREVVAPLVVLGRSRGPLDGGTHAVLVVLAHEDGGKLHTRGEVSTTIMFRSKASKLRAALYLPESGHVVRLEKLTLVGGTVTEHGDRDATGLHRRHRTRKV